MSTVQAGAGGVIFSWHTLGPLIPVKFRLFRGQGGALPSIRNVYLIKWPLGVGAIVGKQDGLY